MQGIVRGFYRQIAANSDHFGKEYESARKKDLCKT